MIPRLLLLALLLRLAAPPCSVVPDLAKPEGSAPLFLIYRQQRAGFMDRYGHPIIQTPFAHTRYFYRDRAAVFQNRPQMGMGRRLHLRAARRFNTKAATATLTHAGKV